MTFAEIQSRAKAEWAALEHGDKPRILIGSATCGRAAGAKAVLEATNAALAQHNLEANITEVGCIGPCYAEPLMDIIKPCRPRICYSQVTPEIVPWLIEDYIINDNPHSDLALGTIGDGSLDGIPRIPGALRHLECHLLALETDQLVRQTLAERPHAVRRQA